MDKILVLNSGSTSVKFQLFEMEQGNYNVLTKGMVDRIGLSGSKIVLKTGNENTIPINFGSTSLSATRSYL